MSEHLTSIKGYVPARELVRRLGLSKSRVHQLIEEYAAHKRRRTIGTLVGRTLLLTESEANEIVKLHGQKRTYTKSA